MPQKKVQSVFTHLLTFSSVRMVYFSVDMCIYLFYGGDQNGIDSFSCLKYCCFSAEGMRTVSSTCPWAELLQADLLSQGYFLLWI